MKTGTDDTDRNLKRNVINESEADLNSLLENATNFVVYRVTADSSNPFGGRVVLVSPSIRAIVGLEDPYKFESWFENIHPEDADRIVDANQKAWQTGTVYDQVLRVFNPLKQQWIWLHTLSTPIFDPEGNLTHFNGLIIDITDQKQAEEELQRQLAFEDIITTISTNFINLESQDFDQGILSALKMIAEFNQVDHSYVSIFSADGKRMEDTHEWCTPEITCLEHRSKERPVSELSWFTKSIKNLQVVYVPDTGRLPAEASEDAKECRRESIQTVILVPMIFRGVAIGFIGFESVRSKTTWSEEYISLLKIFSEILVNALEHKRSQAIQAGQRQFLELLASGGSLAETLHALVQIIEEQWPGMQGLILLLDEDGKHLHIGASVTLPEEYTRSIEGLEIGPMVGSCGTASYYGKRVIVDDIINDPRWDGLRELAVKYGLGACWSEPVISPTGRVIGTFAMYYRHRRSPTEAELRTIEVGAHLAGVAIEHKRAQEELQNAYLIMEQRVEERTRQLSTLLDLSHDLASTLELEPQLGLILDQLKAVVDYSGASIFKLDGDLLRVVAYRGPIPQETALQIQFPISRAGANRKVVKEREPVVIPDILSDSPEARDFRSTAGEQLKTTFNYLRSWMGVPLVVRDQVIGMLSLDHPQPNYYNSKSLSKLALAFANQVAAAIENARIYQQEQERRREADKRRQVAEGLRDILTILNSNRPLDEILESIVKQAVRLTGSNAGVIYRYDAPTQSLIVEAGSGLPEQMNAMQNVPTYRGGAFEAMLVRKPYVLTDISRHLNTLSAKEASQQTGMSNWLRMIKDNFNAYIGVPLVIREETYGSLGLYYEKSNKFSDEEIGLVVAFADQAALAIENARLRTKAEQSAVAAERSRLARDLHDAVTQTLFSASLIAEVLPRLWEHKPEEGMRRLEELRQLTRGALAEMRTLLLELRPAALIEAELGELFRHLTDAFTSRARVQVKYAIVGDIDLPPDVKIALYRIAQEALNNIAKHAEATQAELTIHCHPGGLSMTIRDNGRGFNPAKVSPEHLGMGIMEERADNIGASLTITSQSDKGTQVQVNWSAAENYTMSTQGEKRL
jgi:PAS domain S-box-containing protein